MSTTEVEVIPAGIDVPLNLDFLKAQIAAELASGLADTDAVKVQYGITDEQWEALRKNPVFRGMVADALRTWTGELNAGQRITKKAEIVLEDSIPVLYSIVNDATIPATSRIEAIKEMESLTGRKNKELATNGAGGGFTLNINIGNGKEKLVIDTEATSVTTVE